MDINREKQETNDTLYYRKCFLNRYIGLYHHDTWHVGMTCGPSFTYAPQPHFWSSGSELCKVLSRPTSLPERVPVCVLLSVIRIGKKSKDKAKEKETGDNKSVNITRDGITRIICTAKDSSDHFSGMILTYSQYGAIWCWLTLVSVISHRLRV